MLSVAVVSVTFSAISVGVGSRGVALANHGGELGAPALAPTELTARRW